MKYYPVNLNVAGKSCLVVGGGPVGARKAAMLKKCGADVTAVSKGFCTDFEALAGQGIHLKEKAFDPSDIQGMFLVFAATDDAKLNSSVRAGAQKENILCNVADDSEGSDFILPSVVENGDLVISISTSGKSPALAKKIRQDIESLFGPEYADTLIFMGNLRQRLLEEGHDPESHRRIFGFLIKNKILALVREKDEEKINRLLSTVLTKKCQYKDLVSSRSCS